MQARYFSSTQGRFTSTDPLYFQMMMAIDPQRFNLYAYARNNPLKFVDPNGEKVYLGGDPDWLRTNVLYEMVGGQVNFDRYFQITDGQVVARSGVDTSGANAGVQALLGLVGANENYLYFAGTAGNAAVALFDGLNRNDGTVAPLTSGQTREKANQFEGDGPENQGGTLVGTSGRSGALPPRNLANGDPVFAVIAYNTGAVQTQTAISQVTLGPSGTHVDERGVPIEFGEQVRGLGQRVRPVSLFIHESEENRAFAGMPASQRQDRYNEAHEYAMRREGAIRRALNITGGFAGGGNIQTRVPR